MPSKELEGFGLIVIEALACGTPVIVADTGGLPEAVAGLQGNLVVSAGDVDALANRLDQAFRDSSTLPSSEECREHAELFSPVRLIERHEELYRSVVQGPRARASVGA